MGPPSAKIQVHGGRPLICTSYYDACDNIISRNAIMVMMRGRLRAYDNRICTRKIITANGLSLNIEPPLGYEGEDVMGSCLSKQSQFHVIIVYTSNLYRK